MVPPLILAVRPLPHSNKTLVEDSYVREPRREQRAARRRKQEKEQEEKE